EAGSTADIAFTYQTDFFKLVETGTPQSVRAAISNGADVNARRTGDSATPLMLAAMFSHNPEVITTLLMAGAKAKVHDWLGKTAFDYGKENAYLKGTDALTQLEEASR